MTVKKYAERTNQSVSGVYKKIKSGVIAMNFDKFDHCVCPVCENEFLPNSNRQKYCSDYCFYKHHYHKNKNTDKRKQIVLKASKKRIKKVKELHAKNFVEKVFKCKICHKEYRPQWMGHMSKFCSKKCRLLNSKKTDNNDCINLTSRYVKKVIMTLCKKHGVKIKACEISEKIIKEYKLNLKLKRKTHENTRKIESSGNYGRSV